jgi:hypothetical protein
MRQRADAREADGELAIVGVGQPNAVGLDQQVELGRIDRANGRRGLQVGTGQRGGLDRRQHRFL